MSEPEVPVMVTDAVPTIALEEAVSVSVDVALPFAGGVTGLVENAAVTPLGSPVALSVVAESKPFWLVMVIVLVPLLPGGTVTVVGEAAIAKFGVAGALTVRTRVVVARRLPELPLMVTVVVPIVAVLLAVRVSTLVEVVGLVPKVAVTPLGSPDAASRTLPLNPVKPVTAMVLVPAAPPWVIVRLLGESESVKLGVTVKGTLLWSTPLGVVTSTGPVVAPMGTVVLISEGLTLSNVA